MAFQLWINFWACMPNVPLHLANNRPIVDARVHAKCMTNEVSLYEYQSSHEQLPEEVTVDY